MGFDFDKPRKVTLGGPMIIKSRPKRMLNSSIKFDQIWIKAKPKPRTQLVGQTMGHGWVKEGGATHWVTQVGHQASLRSLLDICERGVNSENRGWFVSFANLKVWTIQDEKLSDQIISYWKLTQWLKCPHSWKFI